MNYKFIIDENYCTGCSSCAVACKDKYDLPKGINFRKVFKEENGIFPNINVKWLTISCNHCIDPECVKSCPTGAVYKRENDGIVLIEEEACIGCKMCIEACPNNSPQFNQETNKCEKCDACIDLLNEGKKPYCVQVCNSRVLDFIEE